MKKLLEIAIVSVAFGLATSCTAETVAPDPLHYIGKGCTRAEVSLEAKLQKIAVLYFKTEVSVPVHDIEVGYVALCSTVLQVPITARTEMVPTKNLWVVDIAAEDNRVMKLERPL